MIGPDRERGLDLAFIAVTVVNGLDGGLDMVEHAFGDMRGNTELAHTGSARSAQIVQRPMRQGSARRLVSAATVVLVNLMTPSTASHSGARSRADPGSKWKRATASRRGIVRLGRARAENPFLDLWLHAKHEALRKACALSRLKRRVIPETSEEQCRKTPAAQALFESPATFQRIE
jgi:hypothetical protein